MTTPLMYLSFLVQKKYNNEKLFSFLHYVEDFFTAQLIDFSKKEYISLFCQFNSFQDLFVYLFGEDNLQQPHNRENVRLIEVVYQEKFPIESSKLEKIWNLSPKGRLFFNEQQSIRESFDTNDGHKGRGLLQFCHDFRNVWSN